MCDEESYPRFPWLDFLSESWLKNDTPVEIAPSPPIQPETLTIPFTWPKFAIFIRDVPNFESEPLLHVLLAQLHQRKIYPNFCYSVVELLKNKRNISKMREYGGKRKPSHLGITTGCNLIMKDLVDHALKSDPEILIVDYLSESIIDVRRIVESVLQREYKVYFLKRKAGVPSAESVLVILEAICPLIHYQNLASIRREQEIDSWWQDSFGITIKHPAPPPATHSRKPPKKKHFFAKTLLDLSDLSDGGGEPGDILSSEDLDTALCFPKETESYCSKMNNALLYCGFANDYKVFMGQIREDEHFNQKWEGIHTLIIVQLNSSALKEITIQKRLFDAFVEKLRETTITSHVIPIGEMVISARCSTIVSEFTDKLGWSISKTFQRIVRDVFFQLYNQEDVVVLDCVHEALVGTEKYIKDALKKKWKVYVLKKNSSHSEEQTIESMMKLLRRRHLKQGLELQFPKKTSETKPVRKSRHMRTIE